MTTVVSGTTKGVGEGAQGVSGGGQDDISALPGRDAPEGPHEQRGGEFRSGESGGLVNSGTMAHTSPPRFPALDFAARPSLIEALAARLQHTGPFWSPFEVFVRSNSTDERSADRVMEAFRSSHSNAVKKLNLEQMDRLCGDISRIFLFEDNGPSSSSPLPSQSSQDPSSTSVS